MDFDEFDEESFFEQEEMLQKIELEYATEHKQEFDLLDSARSGDLQRVQQLLNVGINSNFTPTYTNDLGK